LINVRIIRKALSLEARYFEDPEFYDKLLPVPILNLSVQWIDRLAKSGILGRFRRWEAKFQPRKLNLVHMACWTTLFLAMLVGGYVEGPHEGASIGFWKKAYEEGRPGAGAKLLKLVGSQAILDSGAACNEYGLIHMQGKLVKEDHATAAHYFAKACSLGDPDGCANVAAQFLYLREGRSEQDVARALDCLERECTAGKSGYDCSLIGFAYETGSGRPSQKGRALELYREGCTRGDLDACKGLVRTSCWIGPGPGDFEMATRLLEKGCESGDAESCLYLACVDQVKKGFASQEGEIAAHLNMACKLGSDAACRALTMPDRPLCPGLTPSPIPIWRGSPWPTGR
jgi:TPR repeat protein